MLEELDGLPVAEVFFQHVDLVEVAQRRKLAA
jgi:hypothetical protein